MLHTKFCGNQFTDFGEEDFEGFLTYIGVAAILVMWFRCHEQTLIPPIQGGSTSDLALIAQAVSEKDMFEIVDDDDGQCTDAGPWVYYKLTYEPLAQVLRFKIMLCFTWKSVIPVSGT